MTFKTTLTAGTPQDMLNELGKFFEREGGRLYRLADLATGRPKQALSAQAFYAHRIARMMREIEIISPPAIDNSN